MNEKSLLFRTVSQQELETVCRHYLGASLRSARLLSGGLFNTTYLLETPEQKAVLRLGPVNRHLLLPYEAHLMRAEAELLPLLHAHQIPTSQLIASDPSHRVLDRDIMLVAYIPSVSMADGHWDAETTAALFRQSGELARKMNAITAWELPDPPEKPFGRYSSVLAGHGCGTWREAILLEVDQWRGCAEATGLFPKPVLERVTDCYRRNAWLFDQVGRVPQFIHADLWHGNVLVGADGKVAAIIDCDRALFGDPEFDLAMDWMVNDDFMRGYGTAPDPSPEARLRRRLYNLMALLEECYILQSEYNDPQACQAAKAQILDALDQLDSEA